MSLQDTEPATIRQVDLNNLKNHKGKPFFQGGDTNSSHEYANGSPICANLGNHASDSENGSSEGTPFLKEAETRLQETAQVLAALLGEVSRLKKSIINNSIQDMLRLVFAISKKVILKEIATDEKIIIDVINQALHSAIKSEELHIKVNPEDFSLVNEQKPLFLASISGLENISFESDPQINRGGCLLESSLGQVDATLETKLDEIHQQLLSCVGEKDENSD